MPNLIQLLPDKIVNQIAAGEVIGRPASVVKELMENALDAGSSEIRLIVKDSGKTLIQVLDNGCGMAEVDAELCFQRHATSKIRTVEDLYKLGTMGFRGEALASIAAVAQVELRTNTDDSEIGTRVSIESAGKMKKEACQWEKGSRVSVKNLFYNVPARRNFLKSDAVETKHIIDEFQRIALAHPKVAFTFHHNDNELYHLRPANLRQRIVAIFGNNYNERLVPVSEDTDYVKINGFIGKPEAAKRRRGEQFFFLNGRFIKSGYLNHAVQGAYGNMLPDGAHAFYIINIDIDPAAIDVNVHPTKQEVKFEDEKSVYMIVQAAVKHGLAQYSVTPSIDFDQEVSFKDFEAFKNVFSAQVAEPVREAGKIGPPEIGKLRKASSDAWQKLYEFPGENEQGESVVTVPSNWDEQPELPMREEESTTFQPVQLHKTYILTQIKSGFILIHQNLAHQRILYERYLASFDRNTSCQQLLFPHKMPLGSSDAALLDEILRDVQLLGFDIAKSSAEEPGQYTIKGVPADLVNENPEHLIDNMIAQYRWNADHENIPQRDNIARSLARFTATPEGRGLAETTMTALIDQLFGCREPQMTAYGQPTYIQYSLEHLREQFARV